MTRNVLGSIVLNVNKKMKLPIRTGVHNIKYTVLHVYIYISVIFHRFNAETNIIIALLYCQREGSREFIQVLFLYLHDELAPNSLNLSTFKSWLEDWFSGKPIFNHKKFTLKHKREGRLRCRKWVVFARMLRHPHWSSSVKVILLGALSF